MQKDPNVDLTSITNTTAYFLSITDLENDGNLELFIGRNSGNTQSVLTADSIRLLKKKQDDCGAAEHRRMAQPTKQGTWDSKENRSCRVMIGIYLCYIVAMTGWLCYSGDMHFIRNPLLCYPLLVPPFLLFCYNIYLFFVGKTKYHLWPMKNLLFSVLAAAGVITAIIYLRF